MPGMDHHELEKELAVLKKEIDHIKQRQEDMKSEFTRWQEQQDKRIEKLETTDDDFQREASGRELQKYNTWFTAIVTIGSTIIGAILAYLFSIA